jgi:hypothetical protein
VFLGQWIDTPVALKYCKRTGEIEEFMEEIRLIVYAQSVTNITKREKMKRKTIFNVQFFSLF